MTRGYAWACVAMTIALTVYGQFVLKWQVNLAGALPEGTAARVQYVWRLLLNPWVISAFATAFLASVTWILAMTRLPLSEAYPLTALVFACVVFGGAWIFSEPLSVGRIVGVALIMLGLAVGSRW